MLLSQFATKKSSRLVENFVTEDPMTFGPETGKESYPAGYNNDGKFVLHIVTELLPRIKDDEVTLDVMRSVDAIENGGATKMDVKTVMNVFKEAERQGIVKKYKDAIGKFDNDYKDPEEKDPDLDEDATDDSKASVLKEISVMLTRLEEKIYDLHSLDTAEGSGAGDLTDQIVTMDKLMDNFEAVTARAQKIVPTGSIHRDESVELEEEGAYGIGDSNHEIIMGFVNQWTEAGQPDNYMDDLIAYVKKTIPDSKDWKYAASLIKNGVKSYQDRKGVELEEAQSPAQKAAFQKMLDAKKGKKKDAKDDKPEDKDKMPMDAGKDGKKGTKDDKPAFLKKESVVREGKEDEAELVMASKDMVDRVTGWMEDTAEMQTESMLELADAIRDEMGLQQSDAFVQTVKPALEAMYDVMETTRAALTQGVGMLTGEGEAPIDTMGADPEALDAAPEVDTDMEPTVDQDTDDFAAAEAGTGGEEEAGRAKRESLERSRRVGQILAGGSKKKS